MFLRSDSTCGLCSVLHRKHRFSTSPLLSSPSVSTFNKLLPLRFARSHTYTSTCTRISISYRSIPTRVYKFTVTCYDTLCLNCSNKGKVRRGTGDGGPEDDGDYATLRELPLITSLDPADDSTSEENKVFPIVSTLTTNLLLASKFRSTSNCTVRLASCRS